MPKGGGHPDSIDGMLIKLGPRISPEVFMFITSRVNGSRNPPGTIILSSEAIKLLKFDTGKSNNVFLESATLKNNKHNETQQQTNVCRQMLESRPITS